MFRLLEYFSTLYQLTNLRSDNLFFSYCMGEEEKNTVRYIYFISLAVCHRYPSSQVSMIRNFGYCQSNGQKGKSLVNL